MNVYIDIETIPTQKPSALDDIRAAITPPGNITKEESKATWMRENADSAALKKWHDTGLDGTYGEIICIGFAVDDAAPCCVSREIGGSEAELLKIAFNAIDEVINPHLPFFIGHYAFDFDLRFIYHRAVINEVVPPFPLWQNSRYNGEHSYDTHIGWCGTARDKHIGLDRICAVLGIPVKTGGLDGSKVWEYVSTGRLAEVVEYCKEDVNATREVYKRLTFGGREVKP